MDKIRITEPKHSTVCDRTSQKRQSGKQTNCNAASVQVSRNRQNENLYFMKLSVMQFLSKCYRRDKVRIEQTKRNTVSCHFCQQILLHAPEHALSITHGV